MWQPGFSRLQQRSYRRETRRAEGGHNLKIKREVPGETLGTCYGALVGQTDSSVNTCEMTVYDECLEIDVVTVRAPTMRCIAEERAIHETASCVLVSQFRHMLHSIQITANRALNQDTKASLTRKHSWLPGRDQAAKLDVSQGEPDGRLTPVRQEGLLPEVQRISTSYVSNCMDHWQRAKSCRAPDDRISAERIDRGKQSYDATPAQPHRAPQRRHRIYKLPGTGSMMQHARSRCCLLPRIPSSMTQCCPGIACKLPAWRPC